MARYTFSLDDEADAKIIEFLKAQPNVSAAIREALRHYLNEPSHADLANRLDELRTLVETQSLTPPSGEAKNDTQNEPEAARKGLDRMVRRFNQ